MDNNYNYDLNAQKEYEDNNNPNARQYCIASLICLIVANITFALPHSIFGFLGDYSRYIYQVNCLIFIAGLILAIIAKVYYPKNKFAKVLIILYIVEIVVALVVMVIVVAACIFTFASCINDCSSCGNIG